MKNVVVPVLLFVVSAFLSLTVIYLAFASFIAGAVIAALAVVRTKRGSSLKEKNGGSSLLLRSGVVLMLAPLVTVLLAVAGMFGFLR
jgi:DNA integrity scanning protein DisA with diadenylate cyclase activity